ncbi:hypothetical protein C8R34_10865 [Nitrosomonas sp. Nm84]|nr:hypothetical protein C8R34_10865 [Nitrosomonas sp. Nm84]
MKNSLDCPRGNKNRLKIRIDDVSTALLAYFGLLIEEYKLDAATMTSDFFLFFIDGKVTRHQIPVVRQITGEQGTQAFDIVTPVAVQFACHTEPAHHLHTG